VETVSGAGENRPGGSSSFPYTLRICVASLDTYTPDCLVAAAAELVKLIQKTLGATGQSGPTRADEPATPVEWRIAGVPDPAALAMLADLRRIEGTDALPVEPTRVRGELVTSPGHPDGLRALWPALDWAELLVVFGDPESELAVPMTRQAVLRDCLVLGIDPSRESADPKRRYELVLQEDHSEAHVAIESRAFPSRCGALSRGYEQLAAFNRRPPPLALRDEARCRATTLAELWEAGSSLAPATLAALRDEVVPAYVRADQLAIHYQSRYLRVSKALFWLGAFSVSVVIFQTLFFPTIPGLLLFEIVALVGALVLYLWSHKEKWHEKWLNARYLAERLRCVLFTAGLGLPADNAPDADQILSFYDGPETWLTDIPRRIADQVRRVVQPPSVDAARAYLAGGVRGQVRFHRSNVEKKHSQERWYHGWGLVLFTLALAAALLHISGVGHPHPKNEGAPGPAIAAAAPTEPDAHGGPSDAGHAEPEHGGTGASGDHQPPAHEVPSPFNLPNFLTFLAVAAPACGSALHGILNQLELRRVAARSERMERLLNVLVSQIEAADTLEELRQSAIQASRVMGAETHEWWVLLGFREPVLPA